MPHPFQPGDTVTPITITDWHKDNRIQANQIGIVVSVDGFFDTTRVRFPHREKPFGCSTTNLQHANPFFCGLKHRTRLAEQRGHLDLG